MENQILYAKSPKQLDICLRLLYAENIDFKVTLIEYDVKGKTKLMYAIFVMTDVEMYQGIKHRYEILATM